MSDEHSKDLLCPLSFLNNENEVLTTINNLDSRIYFVHDFMVVSDDSLEVGESGANAFQELISSEPKVWYESSETILKLSFIQLSVVYDELTHMHHSPRFFYENEGRGITFDLEKSNKMNAIIGFER